MTFSSAYSSENCGCLISAHVNVFNNELALLSIDNRSAETETNKKLRIHRIQRIQNSM